MYICVYLYIYVYIYICIYIYYVVMSDPRHKDCSNLTETR